MQAGQPREVPGRNQPLARDIFEVGGELRPERGFQRDILTHRDDPQIGEHGGHFGNLRVELGQIVSVDRDRGVMLAKPGAPGGDIILRLRQFGPQRQRFIFSGAHSPQRQVHPPQRSAAINEGKALADRHFERHPVELVKHTGQGLRRIVLDRNDRAKLARVMPCWSQFKRILTKADPTERHMFAQIAVRQHHRAHLAVIQPRQELQRFGAQIVAIGIDGQQARGISPQRRDQRLACGIKRALFSRQIRRPVSRAGIADQPFQPVKQTAASLQRTSHQRQEQVVDVEFAAAQPLLPALIERARKFVREPCIEHRIGAAAHDVVVDRKTRRADCLQRRIAQFGAVVELVSVGRFKQEPAQPDRLQQQPVARFQRYAIQMARIGQVRACGLLTAGGARVSAQGR